MELIKILLGGVTITALAGITVIVMTKGEALREITKSVIVSTLRLQDEWNKIVNEAKEKYETETGKSKQVADKQIREFGQEAEGAGKAASKV